MSYDIYIGEAVIDSREEDGNIEVSVDPISLPEAPCFRGDTMTGNGNSRHPGYGAWADFLREVGLYDLFLNRESGEALMQEHPGARLLRSSDLDKIREARRAYVAAHPNARPGLCECENCVATKMHGFGIPDKLPHEDNLDYLLVRLIWLEFWVNWAIENCENPTIYNR